jgi:hypothetical protein
MTFADESASSVTGGLGRVSPANRLDRDAAPTADRRPTDDAAPTADRRPTDDAARRGEPSGRWR